MRRTLVRAVALLALVLVTTGCWSRVEVNELAIVTLMAVDQAEDGNLRIWLQIALPVRAGTATGAPGGAGATQGLPLILVNSQGQTILDAATHVQQFLSRRLFWAHMRVIVVGERLAKSGVRPALDFLTRHRELRLTNYLLVVRGDMEEFVRSLVDLERIPAEYLREVGRQRIALTVKVGEFVRMLASPGADAVAGVARVIKPGADSFPQQKALLGIMGAALFKEDRLVGYVDDDEAHGLLTLRGDDHQGMLTFEDQDQSGTVTIQWWNMWTEREAFLQDGQITIRVRTRVDADLVESPAYLDLTDPPAIEALEKQAAERIRQRMERVVKRMQELNVDGAGFGEVVHRQLPAVWKQVEQDWLKTKARDVRVICEARVNIRRTGLSNKPRAVPEGYFEKEDEERQ